MCHCVWCELTETMAQQPGADSEQATSRKQTEKLIEQTGRANNNKEHSLSNY
jgi:hypothetical protein